MNVATNGEFLAREGELAREMHFILSGQIHILKRNGDCDIELFEGAILGEVCLVFDMPSPYDAEVRFLLYVSVCVCGCVGVCVCECVRFCAYGLFEYIYSCQSVCRSDYLFVCLSVCLIICM